MAELFISYARADAPYVQRLASTLAAAGFDVWHDADLRPADSWSSMIREQLDACTAVLVVMSPDGEASKWVERELNYAEKRGKPIVPLLLAGDVYFRLSDLHFEDVRDGGPPSAKLVDRLRRLLPGSTAPLDVGLVHALPGHTSRIRSVAYSPDGRFLATASADGTIRIWESGTGRHRRTLEGNRGPVFGVAYSPDGGQLVSGGDDHTVRLWDPATGKQQRSESCGSPVVSVAWDPVQPLIAAASDSAAVSVLHSSDLSRYRSLTGHTDWARAVAFSPKGDLLATGGDDGTVRTWHARGGDHLSTHTSHTGSVRALAFSVSGDAIASAGYDRTIRILHARMGSVLRTLDGHSALIRSLSFAPDGIHLASAGEDGELRIWNLQTGLCRAVVNAQQRLYAVAFAPGGDHLATGGLDMTVRIWRMAVDARR
ncbi:TIR domain-containing protein [Dactylosporangium sp. NPDC049525]|uniref:toll/interleukin-1 receptor domain-containing protein n=1 Tax=Dactylosporangium sp. NPDC049525 TaxID=3154730 RepID=UPI0034435F25